MSRRILVTLTDGIAEDLDRWAEVEGAKAVSIAAMLVTQGVREAKINGLIPPDETSQTNRIKGVPEGD
ncbi:MAG: hypothetical protein AAF282_02125 [Cyanobacteria bacterium P01_A01_bin.15]